MYSLSVPLAALSLISTVQASWDPWNSDVTVTQTATKTTYFCPCGAELWTADPSWAQWQTSTLKSTTQNSASDVSRSTTYPNTYGTSKITDAISYDPISVPTSTTRSFTFTGKFSNTSTVTDFLSFTTHPTSYLNDPTTSITTSGFTKTYSGGSFNSSSTGATFTVPSDFSGPTNSNILSYTSLTTASPSATLSDNIFKATSTPSPSFSNISGDPSVSSTVTGNSSIPTFALNVTVNTPSGTYSLTTGTFSSQGTTSTTASTVIPAGPKQSFAVQVIPNPTSKRRAVSSVKYVTFAGGASASDDSCDAVPVYLDSSGAIKTVSGDNICGAAIGNGLQPFSESNQVAALGSGWSVGANGLEHAGVQFFCLTPSNELLISFDGSSDGCSQVELVAATSCTRCNLDDSCSSPATTGLTAQNSTSTIASSGTTSSISIASSDVETSSASTTSTESAVISITLINTSGSISTSTPSSTSTVVTTEDPSNSDSSTSSISPSSTTVDPNAYVSNSASPTVSDSTIVATSASATVQSSSNSVSSEEPVYTITFDTATSIATSAPIITPDASDTQPTTYLVTSSGEITVETVVSTSQSDTITSSTDPATSSAATIDSQTSSPALVTYSSTSTTTRPTGVPFNFGFAVADTSSTGAIFTDDAFTQPSYTSVPSSDVTTIGASPTETAASDTTNTIPTDSAETTIAAGAGTSDTSAALTESTETSATYISASDTVTATSSTAQTSAAGFAFGFIFDDTTESSTIADDSVTSQPATTVVDSTTSVTATQDDTAVETGASTEATATTSNAVTTINFGFQVATGTSDVPSETDTNEGAAVETSAGSETAAATSSTGTAVDDSAVTSTPSSAVTTDSVSSSTSASQPAETDGTTAEIGFVVETSTAASPTADITSSTGSSTPTSTGGVNVGFVEDDDSVQTPDNGTDNPTVSNCTIPEYTLDMPCETGKLVQNDGEIFEMRCDLYGAAIDAADIEQQDADDSNLLKCVNMRLDTDVAIGMSKTQVGLCAWADHDVTDCGDSCDDSAGRYDWLVKTLDQDQCSDATYQGSVGFSTSTT